MFDYKHPLGNYKIGFVKFFAKVFSNISLFFLSFLFKIDKSKNEIIISSAFYAPWKDDRNFYHFYHEIKECTLLDSKRLYTLWYLCRNLKNVNGDIFDIGCLQGGAGLLMSKANIKGKTYLFDTFEGFIEEEQFHKKKHFIYKNLNVVKENVSKFKLKNTKVIKCRFPNGLNSKIKKRRIKICHLDVNTYKSTHKSFEFIKNRIVKGGVIVFDDYGIYGADSIKKFVNKISNKYKKNFTFIYNFMGQCILIKK